MGIALGLVITAAVLAGAIAALEWRRRRTELDAEQSPPDDAHWWECSDCHITGWQPTAELAENARRIHIDGHRWARP